MGDVDGRCLQSFVTPSLLSLSLLISLSCQPHLRGHPPQPSRLHGDFHFNSSDVHHITRPQWRSEIRRYAENAFLSYDDRHPTPDPLHAVSAASPFAPSRIPQPRSGINTPVNPLHRFKIGNTQSRGEMPHNWLRRDAMRPRLAASRALPAPSTSKACIAAYMAFPPSQSE